VKEEKMGKMGKMVTGIMVMLLLACEISFGQAVRLDATNPHYFFFRGKPTLLITSAEHYGGVLNKDFNYVAYFDALKSYRLNYTRIYPGALFEPVGKFMPGNTLGPRPRGLILPWARSDQPGYMLGGNKFDLDRWDPEYFARLKDFIKQAGARGIVVEVCLFNSEYSDTWPISPLFAENNIQGADNYDFHDAQTMKHPELVARQDAYVRKIVQEANEFDNVILEICDEPALFTPLDDAAPWVAHFVGVIQSTERELPKQHLIGQEVQGPIGGPIDLSGNPGISVIVTQYLYHSGDGEVGGLQGLDREYQHNKPIEENETDYYPIWYKGDKIADSRLEAWEFMVGGGAGFNQLNGLYTVDNPAGNTPDNAQLLRSLENLRNFLESFDFVRMHPDKKLVVSGVPAGAHWRAISQPGKQYALYLHHGKGGHEGAYEAQFGTYQESLVLNVPAGTYKADWIEPATGAVIRSEQLTAQGGNLKLTTPTYTLDIALRIKCL
jgi:hypothetical protein